MPQNVIDAHQRNNFVQTALLLLIMTAVMCLAGYLLFGTTGLIVATGLLAIGMFFSRSLSAAMILRTYKAQPITPANAPALITLVDEICAAAKISSPDLYYIPSAMPNAFAAGTGQQAFIAITDGLLRLLNRRELAGVLAHEVAHIVNQDIRVLGTADAITRTTSLLSRFGLMLMLFSFSGPMFGMTFARLAFGGLVLFLAPAALVMLQLAISRTREFDADLGAAEILGDPLGLASALQKINPPERSRLMERLWQPGPRRTQPAMLRTHPPTGERVERLVELARLQQAQAALDSQPGQQSLRIELPPVNRRARYHPTNGLWY